MECRRPLWFALLVVAGVLLGGGGVHAGGSGNLLRVDNSFDDSTYVHTDSHWVDVVSGQPDLKKLMDALRVKMNILSNGDLAKAVDAAVTRTGVPRALLQRALFASGQWGTLNAMDKVVKWLLHSRKRAVYRGYEASLGDILHYMYAKKCSYGEVSQYLHEAADTAVERGCEDCIMLLDDVTLARDKYHNFNLAIPYGWVGGLTLFNQMRYKEVIMDLAERLVLAKDMGDDVRQCLASETDRTADDCIVETAFTLHPLIQKLKHEGREWEWISRDVTAPENPYGSDEIMEDIRHLYDHTNRVNIPVLLKAAERTVGCRWFGDPDTKDESVLEPKVFQDYDFLQYLMEFGTLVSFNNLASYAQAAYGVILERFPPGSVVYRRGRKNIDITTMWCAPELYKSSNIVYHILMMNTDADPTTLFYCPDDTNNEAWKKVAGYVDKRVANVMVMDDLAVSGTQLMEYYHFLRSVGRKTMGAYKVHPRVVPLLYTETAKRLFKNTIPRVKAFAGRLIRDGGVGTWMIKSGWSPHFYDMKGFSSVALPYMAPDNNSIFFAYNVAPAFTYRGCGIKKWFGEMEMMEWPRDNEGGIVLMPKCEEQADMAHMERKNPYTEIRSCWQHGWNYQITETVDNLPDGSEVVAGYDVMCTTGPAGNPKDLYGGFGDGGFGDDYDLFS